MKGKIIGAVYTKYLTLPEPNLDQERQQAHALLDLLQPLARSLAQAPVEDEAITPQTAEALNHARASLARGDGIPHEELLREFGLNQ